MHRQFIELAQYLSETLGLEVRPLAWQESARLPHFLQEGYEYAEVTILGVRLLLALDSNPREQQASVVRKQLALVASKSGRDLVYVRPRISAYNRKRLVEHRIPFIAPGNQLYLPMLGIDLREHLRSIHRESQAFSPSTQAALILALLRATREPLTLRDLAARLGYSAMTITRVFDELEAAGIGEVSAAGRRRQFGLVEPNAVTWDRALPFLRNPVRKRVWAVGDKLTIRGVTSGLCALAKVSLISEPSHQVFAMSREDWKTIHAEGDAVERPDHDPDAHEIEIWSYAPRLLADQGIVDPLSLYLSLRNSSDERVEAALRTMLEARGW